MSEAILGALIATGGGIVGGLLALIGTTVIESRARHNEGKQLARSVAAEVRSVISMLEKGRYVENLKALAEQALEGHRPLPIQVTQDYYAITNSNLARIGLMRRNLPDLLARHLTQLKFWAEDMSALHSGGWDKRDDLQMQFGLQQAGEILNGALIAGREFAAAVEREYP